MRAPSKATPRGITISKKEAAQPATGEAYRSAAASAELTITCRAFNPMGWLSGTISVTLGGFAPLALWGTPSIPILAAVLAACAVIAGGVTAGLGETLIVKIADGRLTASARTSIGWFRQGPTTVALNDVARLMPYSVNVERGPSHTVIRAYRVDGEVIELARVWRQAHASFLVDELNAWAGWS